LATARRAAPEIDPSVFAFLARLLSGKLVEGPHSGFSRVAVLKFAMKFQQLSGPVMAKGLEDTAFYRYNRFIALNEVGGEPDRFGCVADELHAALAERARRWPHALSATATHDTKRGEDARARLAVLSELADEWSVEVREWRRILRGSELAAPPEPNAEYYFYQSLLGAWPAELCAFDQPPAAALEELAQRLKLALTKAMREAKRHTNWASPDERYEAALLELVDAALVPTRDNAFLARFVPFVRRIARLGVRNSLVQLTLKLMAPGVPDVYQGADAWDFSLVDPDNRRSVDFAARDERLAAVERSLRGERGAALARMLDEWHDGAIKLAVTRTLLELRARERELFIAGEYVPCEARGPRADEVVAFVRRRGDRAALAAVQRFPARAERADGWRGTRLCVPGGIADGRDVLTGRGVDGGEEVDAGALFATLPVAVAVTTTVANGS
jgi:(1->4)-alpha-D-glucan 1-alpha-D-glucosylmutase